MSETAAVTNIAPNIVPEHVENGDAWTRRAFLAAASVAGIGYAAALAYPVYRYLASPSEMALSASAVTEVTLKDAQKLPAGSVLMFKFGTAPAMLIHHADNSWVALTADTAAAALADSSGAHSGAFYFLLAAVPVLIVGELMVFGDLVEAREIESKIALAAQAFLSLLTLALVLVIVGSSAGPLLEVSLPLLGVSALGVCLGLFAVQVLLGMVARVLAVVRRPVGLYVRAGAEFAPAERFSARHRATRPRGRLNVAIESARSAPILCQESGSARTAAGSPRAWPDRSAAARRRTTQR